MGDRSFCRRGGPCRCRGGRPVSWTSARVSCWRLRPTRSRWRRCAGGSGSAGTRATSGCDGGRRRAPPGWPTGRGRRGSHPQAVAEELLEACLALRRQHPTWGPEKVKAALERRSPGRPWPAASTIGARFDREGLTVRRRLRRRTPPGGPLCAADAANDVWAIDFKGWFRTGDGTRVDPLDAQRRAAAGICCAARRWTRPDATHVWPILDAAFREHGLPRQAALRQRIAAASRRRAPAGSPGSRSR